MAKGSMLTRICFIDVPIDAVEAYRVAKERTGSSVSSIVYLCLRMLLRPPQASQLFWVPTQTNVPELVSLEPISSERQGNWTVNLRPQAIQLFVYTDVQFGWNATQTLARAANLAPYYGRSDGRIAAGRKPKKGSVEPQKLHYYSFG